MLQIFAVSHRSETSEIMPFFVSKRSEIFASISIFASKAKRRAHPFSNFSVLFRFTSIFSLNFAYFTFVFASDICCFASKWNKRNHAFFSLPSETKFSLRFQFSLPKRKRGRTLPQTQCKNLVEYRTGKWMDGSGPAPSIMCQYMCCITLSWKSNTTHVLTHNTALEAGPLPTIHFRVLYTTIYFYSECIMN